jgi:hypothetical protein
MTTWEKASESLSKVDGATRKRAREIFDAAQAAGYDIWYMWGYDNDPSNTEHHSGRALDLMVKNHETGQWIRDYIWRNRERLSVQHVIWEQHITSTVTQPGVVRLMADRGNTTANHMDHNHVLFFDADYVAPGGGSTPTDPKPGRSVTEVAQAVLRGDYGNGQERIDKLRSEGYDPNVVQAEVNRLMGGDAPVKKSVSQIANEIIAGTGGWGNGDDRVNRLRNAGYDPAAVQAEVNRLMTPKGESKPKLSITQVAKQIIAGIGGWGNGSDRVNRLTRAGYDANAVQREVNRLMA